MERYEVLQLLSDEANCGLGTLAGVIEAGVTQPLTYVKNSLQQRVPVSFDPRIAYRGTPASFSVPQNFALQHTCVSSNMHESSDYPHETNRSCAADGILIGSQFVACGWLQKSVAGPRARPLAFWEEVGCATLAGAASGLPCCVLELVMIQQQRFGTSAIATARRLVKDHGGFLAVFRGLGPTAAREALFAAGYLGVSPQIERLVVAGFSSSGGFGGQRRRKTRDDLCVGDLDSDATTSVRRSTTAGVGEWGLVGTITPESLATPLASLVSGLACAALTHPLDTIKSCMQGDVSRHRYGSLFETAATIWREGGGTMRPFFRGYAARAGIICLCFYIFSETKLQLGNVLFPSQLSQQTPKRHENARFEKKMGATTTTTTAYSDDTPGTSRRGGEDTSTLSPAEAASSPNKPPTR